jgi:hypothetical protein
MDNGIQQSAPTTWKQDMSFILPGKNELRFLPLIAICAALGCMFFIFAWAASIPVAS